MRWVVSRRRAMLGAAAGAVAWAAAEPSAALGPDNGAAELIRAFAEGVEPKPGRISLDLPEIAENGAAVPMTVRVASPMTATDHCVAVLVAAEANPYPAVVRFEFTPLSGRAEATTRIRLAASQTVTAVARMSDGACFVDRRAVIVTIGGCEP